MKLRSAVTISNLYSLENSPLNQLFNSITCLYPLTDREISVLKDNVKTFSTDPETDVIKPLSIADSFFFLQKGVVRSFYQKDYKEINTEFFFENEFFTAFTIF